MRATPATSASSRSPMGDGLRWHSSHGEERTEQASSPLRHELSTMCSGPTCSAILLPSFPPHPRTPRSEEHTSELQSLMRISYAVFCLKKKKDNTNTHHR